MILIGGHVCVIALALKVWQNVPVWLVTLNLTNGAEQWLA